MYSAPITRTHKAAFVILIDRSGSMAEEVVFQGRTTTKAEALAEAVNSLLEEIINRSRRERYVGDYFDVAILGYGGEGVESLLGSGFKSIVDIDTMDTPTTNRLVCHTLPSGKSFSTIVERRCWVEPQASGKTPMGEALKRARRMVAAWCRKHPESHPPIVINISDGEATDATHQEITALAEGLKRCSTNDGEVLLMNIHLACEHDTPSPALRFPTEGTPLPVNRHSQLLYDISSTLPPFYNASVAELRGEEPPFRAVCYNAPIDDLVGLLAIGSLSMDQMI